MNTKQSMLHVLAALVIAVWANACMQADVPLDEAVAGQDTESAGQATPFEEVRPGEAFEESSVEDADLTGKGCVYIEWCDAPGERQAVCRLRSGCACNDAAWEECFDDLDYVCGNWVLTDFPECGL